MKIEKNKIVFAAVFAVVVLFLVSYCVLVLGGDKSEAKNLKQTLVPALVEVQKEYGSKLDAVNDLKEVREINVPNIYDDKLINALGYYDPDLPDLQKEQIIDSIYNAGRIQYSEKRYQNFGEQKKVQKNVPKVDSVEIKRFLKIEAKELGLEHQLFFASVPKESDISAAGATEQIIYAVVDGHQVIMANSRLRMRLSKAATIRDVFYPKNTPLYGFVSFKPNRAMISIESIGNDPSKLQAYDLEDGSEGIYIENSFHGDARQQIIGDMVEDINVAGVPQINGVKQLFRRNNRNVKVTVMDGYHLALKVPKGQ